MKPRYLFFALFTCFAVPGRFYPLFLQAYGENAAEIGILLSLGSLANLLATPAISHLADYADDHEKYVIILIFVTISALLTQTLALPSFSLLPSPAWTFSWLFLTTAVFMVASVPLNTLVTAITVRDLRIVHAESAPAYYGRERLWGAVSWAIVSILFGALLDIQGVDFHIVYFIYPPLALILAFTVYIYRRQARNLQVTPTTNLPHVDPTENADTAQSNFEPSSQQCLTSWQMWTYLISRHDGIQSLLFFILVFAVSVGMVVLQNMQFLFFVNQLSATNLYCGLLVLVTVVFEIPLFAIAPTLTKVVGNEIMLIIAAIGLVIRAITYVVFTHVSSFLWVEPLHGVTYATMQVASVAYVASRAPPQAEAAAQAVATVCRAAGSIVGSTLGGLVFHKLGPHFLFLSTSIFVFAAAIAFAIANILFKFFPSNHSHSDDTVSEASLLVRSSSNSKDGLMSK